MIILPHNMRSYDVWFEWSLRLVSCLVLVVTIGHHVHLMILPSQSGIVGSRRKKLTDKSYLNILRMLLPTLGGNWAKLEARTRDKTTRTMIPVFFILLEVEN